MIILYGANEVNTMTKSKQKSTYDRFFEKLSPQEKKEFEQEYQDLLISELLIAIMKQDNVSIRKLAAAAGVSPTIIQGIRSGARVNFSAQSLFKILHSLGYELVAQRGESCFPINLYGLDKE
jgi:hypothetical protein